MFSQLSELNENHVTLTQLLRPPDTEAGFHDSFFYHAPIFYGSTSNEMNTGAQLFASVNSACDIDQAMTVQYYINYLHQFSRDSTETKSHRDAIHFVARCIAKDPLMPPIVIDFVNFLSESLHKTNVQEIMEKLVSVLPAEHPISALLST